MVLGELEEDGGHDGASCVWLFLLFFLLGGLFGLFTGSVCYCFFLPLMLLLF